ncbi:hypothetical protein SODALDRAFT_328006 [Sodiomyces alkalinus F11]|uniref:Uncharacterized protein n=1 Tax=Sodiomyces alkalinus (strain CBS 110278 / VKM F-3762 / F11) TaxID=1314773 RepID=A0A3N2QAP7_SODAK|nr:hypothetical protein SODALDRAFT_328006 [Sodiomyces alkalinus F11]ROT43787.1 hypothetical protein SODALDRAFT_328006 [Sodiomyces alkalinus F11]
MALTETITIINNSGKIISTGRELLGVFKEAKASYQAKKAAIRADRAFLQRSQTFDAHAPPAVDVAYQRPVPQGLARQYYDDNYAQPFDDARSQVSHRSYQSYRSHRSARTALTADNLRSHSEVASVPPSRGPPPAYHSPYAETAPRDMTLSRPTLHHTHLATPSVAMPSAHPRHPHPPPPGPGHLVRSATFDVADRPRKVKEIDMNLAYGNVPPDLATRVDLDPAYQGKTREVEAKGLIQHVEHILDETQCVGHSATATIKRLQDDPKAAAAVALSLAELSKLVGSMSPAFLGALKGGSPAVFALLASPQFLIAAGVTVGVTVVMFGGWKIVKQVKERKALQAAAAANAIAYPQIMPGMPVPEAGYPMGQLQPQQQQPYGYPETMVAPDGAYPRGYAQEGYEPGYEQGYGEVYPEGYTVEGGDQEGFDEAVVLEEQLSTIETWRRGIEPLGDGEIADMELISPEAERAVRKQRRQEDRERRGDHAHDDDADDAESRSGRTETSSRTHRSHRSHRSHKTHHSRRDRDRESEDRDRDRDRDRERERDRERDRDGDSLAGSHRSHRSHRSKRSARPSTLAIEEGREDDMNTGLEAVLRPKKENMLKSLFKKKDKGDRGKEDRVSAVVF